MARRIRIPLLVNAAIVSDEAELARLNNEPSVERELSGRGGLIHRLLFDRVTKTFAIGATRLLPVFEPQSNVVRANEQQQTNARLTSLASTAEPFDRNAVVALGRYVAGGTPEVPIGVTTQQLIGRLIDQGYVATHESYTAARVVAATLSSCPVTMLRVRWWTLSGRLTKSRTLLWSLAKENPVVIHSTTIAIHNLVDSLVRMRKAMRTNGPWHATPAEAAADALVAPSMLLRQCPRATQARAPFPPDTLVLFRLRKIHEGTASNDLAFSRSDWSECPAHAIVPRLLEDVWRTAVAERASERYRRSSWGYRFVGAPVIRLVTRFNRRVPWYRLPLVFGFLNLAVLRTELRARNLYDTTLLPSTGGGALPPASPDVLRWRTADGSFNDLRDPSMGRAGTRFGRNVSLGYTYSDPTKLLVPDPRLVSRKLLTRDEFHKAPGLNVLAAAWIQFQVHDWFSHGDSDPNDPITIPIAPDDPWPGAKPMQIGRTRRDPTRSANPPVGPPTYLNKVTHWWDASQLYGSDAPTQRLVRSGAQGKLVLDAQGRLPLNAQGVEITGFNDNWWLGLSLLHHLFTHEHNAICDRLRAEYPDWDDERLFQTARLVNAALIAKIHDVEWVPTILAHPTVRAGLYSSWWGLLGKWVATNIGRFHAIDMLGGVPGSATNHHTAPYAITEEFVSVYRMHALMMPDDFPIYRAATGAPQANRTLTDILGAGAGKTLTEFGMVDLLFSFGRILPGKLQLGNYPKALQEFRMPTTGTVVDLATVDIVRDRERGVPRYNQFRELLHLQPVRSFDEFDPDWVKKLQEVYATVDDIDLMVGLFAEISPPGFGFSETTFRIFLLMNSRRLKSDRFFTTDYRPTVYTQVGLDWIDENGMRSVLLRHYPALAPALANVRKVFAPW